MASPSVTNIFANSTVADATQVNKNFQDLIDGMTDGTKDLAISALSTAGNTTLGNASADDLVVSASLASHLVPKTDGTYDLGSSSLGMRAVYLGDAGGDTAKIVPPALAADIVLTTPASTSTLLGHNAQQVPYLLAYLPSLLTTNTGVTATLLGTVLVDTHSAYASGTGTFTCPESGVYEMGAVVEVACNSVFNGTTEVFSIVANTTASTGLMTTLVPPNATVTIFPAGHYSESLASGNTIQVQVLQTSGSNVNVPGSVSQRTRFWIRKVPGTN